MLHHLLVLAAMLAADPPEKHAGLETPWLHEAGWTPLIANGSTAGWHARDNKASTWTACRSVDTAGDRLTASKSPGATLVNGPDGKTADLVTDRKFGDVELYVEWLIPKGSNSGVYLQGLYEVQIFDSYSKSKLSTIDAGAIYNKWIDERPVGGSAPRVNASLPSGEWQSFHIWFRAPRFDGAGKKIANARFDKVVYNGRVVQEGVEIDGPTRAHMDILEAATNPLMLQGDHGPVAFRNVWVKSR